MNIQSAIGDMYLRAAKELNIAVEERLQVYFNKCNSTNEFIERMESVTFRGIPLMNQYIFDGVPVFYSLVTFTDNKINVEVKNGEYKIDRKSVGECL
jgi:penicillin V acylase-like amidase (Ntn superfamily)